MTVVRRFGCILFLSQQQVCYEWRAKSDNYTLKDFKSFIQAILICLNSYSLLAFPHCSNNNSTADWHRQTTLCCVATVAANWNLTVASQLCINPSCIEWKWGEGMQYLTISYINLITLYLSFFPSLDLVPLFTDMWLEMSIVEMLLFLFSKNQVTRYTPFRLIKSL